MFRKKEKGFALVLSLILLLAMSLMGGALIVITSCDHRSNNNSDQYQQVFYVAETGLMQGEKWVIDNYLGHWMTSVPSVEDSSLGTRPAEGEAAQAEYDGTDVIQWPK
jgi:Tfp pilus assembly protein PilX